MKSTLAEFAVILAMISVTVGLIAWALTWQL